MEKKQELDRRLLENIFRNIPVPVKSNMQNLIEQIESYRNEKQRALYMCPILFLKARWELKSQLRSIDSILTVAKRLNS